MHVGPAAADRQKHHFDVSFILIACGIALMWAYRRYADRVDSENDEKVPYVLSKNTQSQVTYTRKASTPRFKPLPEFAHG